MTHDMTRKDRTFEGISEIGDFKEALGNALDAAYKALAEGPDAFIEWSLGEVSGRKGGFTGGIRMKVEVVARPADYTESVTATIRS